MALDELDVAVVVSEVAEMLGDEGPVVTTEADGRLELRATRQRVAGKATDDPHRPGRVTAGAADHDLTVDDHPGDRVVDPDVDVAVVHAEQVGDGAEPLDGQDVVGDRWARATGCHW